MPSCHTIPYQFLVSTKSTFSTQPGLAAMHQRKRIKSALRCNAFYFFASLRHRSHVPNDGIGVTSPLHPEQVQEVLGTVDNPMELTLFPFDCDGMMVEFRTGDCYRTADVCFLVTMPLVTAPKTACHLLYAVSQLSTPCTCTLCSPLSNVFARFLEKCACCP